MGTGKQVMEFFVPKVMAECNARTIGGLVQEAIKKDAPPTGTDAPPTGTSGRSSRSKKGPAEPDEVKVVHETHGEVVVYLKREGVEKMMEKETKSGSDLGLEYKTFYDNLD